MSGGSILVPLDIKTMATVVLFGLGAIGGLLRLMLHLFQKHLDERAASTTKQLESFEESIEDALDAHQKLIEQRICAFENSQRVEQERLSRLEAAHQALHNNLAMRFVQREDFIRFASSIDHKIDRLGELFTRFTMRGTDT